MSDPEEYIVAKYHLGAWMTVGGFVYNYEDAKELAKAEFAEVFQIRKVG